MAAEWNAVLHPASASADAERLLYKISLPQLVRAADEVTTDEQL